uniref:Progonadoliberin-1 n=1 Tax=Otus sunia TaxID=257818 RepID=A0A8C8E7C8_9STRI
MEKSRKIFVSVLLFVMSVEICLAQHWSYGLQPGGKRNVENLVESVQEIASEMEKLGDVQKMECPGSSQHSRFSELKEAVVSNMFLILSVWENQGNGPGWEST